LRKPWSNSSCCWAVKPSILMRPIGAKISRQYSLN
jgi:hypothetical protein